jgi:hypothetical protein
MTCLWHVRAVTDQGAPRAANRIPDGSPKNERTAVALSFSVANRDFEGGTAVNDVPVARQSRDRPRRAARRESNPRWFTKE